MKRFGKWKVMSIIALIISILAVIYSAYQRDWIGTGVTVAATILFALAFIQFWLAVKKRGIQTELDISRVLGKDAKDALSFGNVGLLTYNDEYTVTWQSSFFNERGLDLVNKQLTSWIHEIRSLFEDEVDFIVGYDKDLAYEITRKSGSNLLYVKDVTSYQELSQKYMNDGIVVGLLQLDNYIEYQSYENETLIANINTHLRMPLVNWARDHGMLIRRLRSDRFFVVLNQSLFEQVKKENFNLLQIIKDEARALDVSITLSMAFAYGTNDFEKLDNMVNDLIETAQSRGGDQAAFRNANGTIQFVGGNSENNSSRSKVRVHTMAQSIQGTMKDKNKIFIAGHTMTDFDCMGAALSVSCWARSIGKKVYIVLNDVVWDDQLGRLMNRYASIIYDRHSFLTPLQAKEMMDFDNDLLIMVDHGVPSMSSAEDFIDSCKNVLVIDHHRKGESFVQHSMLTYIESTASSACELIVELIQNVPNTIPIYEAEATIMYLGILVDTNRFKMHTDARTFEAAAALRSWGANQTEAENALCVDISEFNLKNQILEQATMYKDQFMIACLETKAIDKTMLAQVAQSLLMIKDCSASFVIGYVKGKNKVVGLSARSNGCFNVQKIVENLHGGGHFSAAAVERNDVTPKELYELLLKQLEEENHESNHVERRS